MNDDVLKTIVAMAGPKRSLEREEALNEIARIAQKALRRSAEVSRPPSRKHHRYSGDGSSRFWKRVNALDGENHAVLYSLGCVLQNLEEHVLQMLVNAEKTRDHRTRK